MPGFEAQILPKRPLFPQEEKNTKYISAMERSLSCTIFALRKAFGPWDSVPSELVVPQRAATVPTPRTYCFDSLSPACHLAYLTLHIPDYSPGQNHIFPTEENYRKGAKIQRGREGNAGFSERPLL